MTRQRNSHQQKTLYERRVYMETQILGASPTTDDLPPPTDSTNEPLEVEPQDITPVARTKQQGWWARQFKEEPVKAIVRIGSTLLLMVFGWFAYQVYFLNREAGEIKTKIETLSHNQKGFLTEIEKVEKRIFRNIDKMSHRIDRVENKMDSFNYSRANQKKQ